MDVSIKKGDRPVFGRNGEFIHLDGRRCDDTDADVA
jgi:hypothetical protein